MHHILHFSGHKKRLITLCTCASIFPYNNINSYKDIAKKCNLTAVGKYIFLAKLQVQYHNNTNIISIMKRIREIIVQQKIGK